MSTEKAMSRRRFLGATGALAATTLWTAKSYAKVLGANDRIGYAVIGAGNMGTQHLSILKDLRQSDNLDPVAVADCWLTRAEKGAQLVGAPKALRDYRPVLDLVDVDCVTIATPEFRHAEMTLAALDAGKAVYCEKPMTHTIEEAQAVVKKQKETGLPLQVGIQGMADDSYATAAEAIRKGLIGRVVQAQTEYVRHYGKLGPWRLPEVTDATPKPDDLDWNTWLGDAPKVPWNPHYYFEWKNYSAYSGGIASELFVHRLARIIKACDLELPRRVVGMGGIWQWPDGRQWPDNLEILCEYPRGMTVYFLGTMSNKVGVDHLIRGNQGTLYFTATGWVAKDRQGKLLAEYRTQSREELRRHRLNLHNHLRNGEPLRCPTQLGLATVVPTCMANASWQTAQMMGWDRDNARMAPANSLPLIYTPEEGA